MTFAGSRMGSSCDVSQSGEPCVPVGSVDPQFAVGQPVTDWRGADLAPVVEGVLRDLHFGAELVHGHNLRDTRVRRPAHQAPPPRMTPRRGVVVPVVPAVPSQVSPGTAVLVGRLRSSQVSGRPGAELGGDAWDGWDGSPAGVGQ